MSELWIDTDLGFDDIHALLLLRCHKIHPVAHSLVFGCSTLEHVVKNAQGLESVFGFGSIWHCGAEAALDGQCRTAEHVLGKCGMLSRGLKLPQVDAGSAAFLQDIQAVEGLIKWLSSNPINPQILALGPLSNLAQLITTAPDIAATLSKITWMGGSCGRGNQTAYAEFNAWADAEAAAIVMQSGIHVHIVELEACRKLQLVSEDLEPLSLLQNHKAKLIHDLLGGYLDIALSRGRTGMALYDPLAAAAVVVAMDRDAGISTATSKATSTATSGDKDILGSTPVNISIETASREQSGRTRITPVADPAEARHSLCVVNNIDAVHDMLLDALYKTAKETAPDPA